MSAAERERRKEKLYRILISRRVAKKEQAPRVEREKGEKFCSIKVRTRRA